MAYQAIDVAKWFINAIDREAGESISHLKVQKLLYFAEAWTQLVLDEDLFEEQIEAWAHGPVVPDVYYFFKGNSWDGLPPQELDTDFTPDVIDVLTQVLDIYGEFSAKTLEDMTHADAPWIEARGGVPAEARCSSIMEKPRIKVFFAEKYGQLLNEQEAS
ncbi:MAG: DUF4065 domain-containing protein [Methylobacter sp.]|nr:DUF4065 domain-containing protein [Methylobacter sp.]